MKSLLVLSFLSFSFSSCVHSQASLNIQSQPWIPRKVNWNEGSFETLYFYNDSCFIKIASTQVLTEKDSVNFMSEPGFILYSGKYSILKSGSEILLSYRLLYRAFKLTGEKLPSDYMSERLFVNTTDKGSVIKMKDVPYIKGEKVTKESYQKLQDIIEKFLPTLLN